MALLRRIPHYAITRAITAFASPEADAPVRGWLARAADEFGVEFRAVDVQRDLRERVLQAQQPQVMVDFSPHEGADEMI